MEIRLDHLTKVFKDKAGKEVKAVNNFDDVLPDGKLIGLLGPSGCGKSTTLYMIAGLLDPTVGRIFFGKNDVTDLSAEKRGIGLVFQNYALYPHMTVRQNITFPLENIRIGVPVLNENGEQILDKNGNPKTNKRKMHHSEIHETTIEMAKLVGIGELLDRKPSELSGGQQQRVAIARALAKKPQVLLLDEPLSNLDARLRLQTREEIRRIQKETGITTIFVTHDQEEAMSISDQIILMNHGIIQQKDEPQKVYDNPNNLFVAKFLGTPPIAIYNGRVENNVLYIGNEAVYSGKEKLRDITGNVKIGIRPEGYTLSTNGKLTLSYGYIEKIGRDIALVCTHPNSDNDSFRVILSDVKDIPVSQAKFELKPEKFYIFDYETGERLDRDGGPVTPPPVWVGTLEEIEKAKKDAKKAQKAAQKAGNEYVEVDFTEQFIADQTKGKEESKQTEVKTEKPAEEPAVVENELPAVEKISEPVIVDSEPKTSPVKPAIATKKVSAPVKEEKSVPNYHVSRNNDKGHPNNGEWRVRKAGSDKTIKYLPNQEEAIKYAEGLAKGTGASVVIHKLDGTIRRQNYKKG